MEMLCHKETKTGRHYLFICPSCGEQGEIELDPKDTGQFGCPAECGASFIEYPGLKGWTIRCVVQPVFEDEPEDHDLNDEHDCGEDTCVCADANE